MVAPLLPPIGSSATVKMAARCPPLQRQKPPHSLLLLASSEGARRGRTSHSSQRAARRVESALGKAALIQPYVTTSCPVAKVGNHTLRVFTSADGFPPGSQIDRTEKRGNKRAGGHGKAAEIPPYVTTSCPVAKVGNHILRGAFTSPDVWRSGSDEMPKKRPRCSSLQDLYVERSPSNRTLHPSPVHPSPSVRLFEASSDGGSNGDNWALRTGRNRRAVSPVINSKVSKPTNLNTSSRCDEEHRRELANANARLTSELCIRYAKLSMQAEPRACEMTLKRGREPTYSLNKRPRKTNGRSLSATPPPRPASCPVGKSSIRVQTKRGGSRRDAARTSAKHVRFVLPTPSGRELVTRRRRHQLSFPPVANATKVSRRKR